MRRTSDKTWQRAAPAGTIGAMSQTYSGDFSTGQGGVFTDEVGVITGPVTLRTTVDGERRLVVEVQYQGADEWYTVKGGSCTLHDAADAEPVHRLVLAVLARGGEGDRPH
ncbi:hypothetical protein GCM10009635_50010 [Actinocatenispora thailandica]